MQPMDRADRYTLARDPESQLISKLTNICFGHRRRLRVRNFTLSPLPENIPKQANLAP